ncbi:MAG: tryptophan synthase subunit alpha [Bryobacteraceae bacterium]|nr:tryptophan synthase subunit alpha [Solibacteraceae bacterium]MCL4844230.1 tryptophan synthase subunit alpha [Bryobacteraceae bacterium]MCO5349753.1 tryptophan synthase subunit alpha [Bryobacteraceae bacterium]
MESSPRIKRRFAQRKFEGRPALVAYLTAGDPSPEATPELALALERGGADILELGVPFSDPIADGPVIQRASDRALHAGATVARVLDIASRIREKSEMPIVLFSYMNPLLRFGFDRLGEEAARRGIDGVLLTDLSVEEAAEPVAQLRRHGLDTVFLAAPTSTERRLKLVAEYSSGFIYVVSRTGVTGEQDSVAAGVAPLVEKIRALSELPVAVGFGVSRAEHVQAIGQYADGAVVGSALMRLVEEHGSDPGLPARLEAFARELTTPAEAPQ